MTHGKAAPPVDTVPPAGPEVGPYRIERLLGRGAMGEVYVAQDSRNDKRVALKVLPSSLLSRPSLRHRLYEEGLLAASLQHPNICTIFEIGEADGRPFVAMEYVEGESLRAFQRTHEINTSVFLELAIQLADALREAHGRGIVHRDFTGANIVVTASGRVKILDFGLATGLHAVTPSEDPDSTRRKIASVSDGPREMGAPEYASPEQVTSRRVDARSDLFSLGVVLHELLTGRLPFVGDNRTELFRAILNNTAIPVDRINDSVPVALSNIVTRLLAKNREHRYQSAADVLEDLRRIGRPPRRSSRDLARRLTGNRWFHRIVGSAAGVVFAVSGILPATIAVGREAEAAIRATSAPRSGVWTGLVGSRAFAPVATGTASPNSIWIGGNGAIVYDASRQAGGSSIWTIAFGEGAPRVLQASGRAPSLSADGRVMVFVGDDDYLYRQLAGGRPVLVLDRGVAGPVLSRDGRSVVYLDARTRTIWQTAIDDARPGPVTSTPADSGPLVSPDGLRLAFAAGGQTIVCDMPACTNPTTLPLRAPQAWTPDGQALAYVGAPRQANVWAMPIDGSSPRQLTSFTERQVSSVAWSAAGTRLAVARVMTLSDFELLTRFK